MGLIQGKFFFVFLLEVYNPLGKRHVSFKHLRMHLAGSSLAPARYARLFGFLDAAEAATPDDRWSPT